jgi:microcystin degradation protein MlrC
MLDNDVKNAVYTCVADSAAYSLCAAHKENDVFHLSFGGGYSGKADERLSLDVRLISLKELQGVLYAVLQAKDVKFVISNKRCATYSPETLRNLGLPPESFNIIGIKAGYLSPEYQDISKLSILALTQGDTALDLRSLPYVKTPRPIYPLDIEMKF